VSAPQACCPAGAHLASCLSLCLIHPRPGPFTSVRSDRVCAVRGRWRTPVNAGQHCWKACWGQPLASSNLASSATSDQAIHELRSCVRAALARLRSLIRSLIHSTYIGIKRPKGVGARFWVPRPCSRPLDVPVLGDLLGAGAQQAVAGEREGVCLASLRAAGQEAVSPLAGPPSSLNPATARAVSSRTAANEQLGRRLKRSGQGSLAQRAVGRSLSRGQPAREPGAGNRDRVGAGIRGSVDVAARALAACSSYQGTTKGG